MHAAHKQQGLAGRGLKQQSCARCAQATELSRLYTSSRVVQVAEAFKQQRLGSCLLALLRLYKYAGKQQRQRRRTEQQHPGSACGCLWGHSSQAGDSCRVTSARQSSRSSCFPFQAAMQPLRKAGRAATAAAASS